MEKLMNLKEAMEYLHASKSSMHRWDKEGKLVPLRTSGGHRRYKLKDLEEFSNDKQSYCEIGKLYEYLCNAQYQANTLVNEGLLDEKIAKTILNIREDVGQKLLENYFNKVVE